MRVTATGELMTDLNLTESIGINPKTNNTYTMGQSESRWSAGYFNTLYAGTISTVTGLLTLGPTSGIVDIYKSGTDSSLIVSDSSGTTQVQLNSNGDSYFTGGSLGIGTNSPSSELHVVGDLNVTGTAYLATVNMTGVIYSEGTVGIGAPSPGAELHVAGDTNITGSLTVAGGIEGVTNVSVLYGNNGTHMKPLLLSSDGRLKLEIEQANAVNSSNLLASASGADLTLTGDLIVDTTDLVVDVSENKVGIGTASPGAKLTVADNGMSSSYLMNLSVDDANPYNLLFNRVDSAQDWVVYIGSGDSDSLIFRDLTDSSRDVLTLGGDGNVGIGTTSPSKKLNVVATGGVPLRLERTDGLAGIQLYRNELQGDDAVVGRVEFKGQDSATNEVAFSKIEGTAVLDNDGSEEGSLNFYTRKAGVFTEKVTIDASGNVGIGTTGPETKLHVSGDSIALDNTYGIHIKDAGGTRRWVAQVDAGDDITIGDTSLDDILFDVGGDADAMVIKQTTGNVGIGTTGPSQLLEIEGSHSSGNDGLSLDATGAGNMQVRWLDSGVEKAAITYVQSGTDLRFYNEGDRMTIQNSGNVGIGTTSPDGQFNVESASGEHLTVNFGGYDAGRDVTLNFRQSQSTVKGRIMYDAGNDKFFLGYGANAHMAIDSSGNVGIGTTVPSNRLHIDGIYTGDQGTYYATEGLRISGGPYNAYTELVAVDAIEGSFSQWYQQFKIKMKRNNGDNVLDVMDVRRSTDTITVSFPNGNVGIGTASPTAALHILGDGTAISIDSADYNNVYLGRGGNSGGDLDWGKLLLKHDGGTATVRLYADGDSYFNAGNVGIGTTGPSAPLDVSRTTSSETVIGEFASTTTNRGIWLGMDATGGASNPVIQSYRPSDGDTSGYQLSINPNGGNVGIGTTSPTARLMIQNPATASDYEGVRIDNDETGAYALELTGSSTLGIKLDPLPDNTCYDQGGSSACSINADYAELMYTDETDLEDGDVMVINPDESVEGAEFVRSTKPYDRLVGGVYSETPAMVIGPEGTSIKGWDSDDPRAFPLALSGRKRIKVSDENGAVKKGDLLVTSSESGKAMRCEIKEIPASATNDEAVTIMRHNELCRNTAVAKAMTSVGEDGKVLALITLQ